MADDDALLALIADAGTGILMTIKRNGRPQASLVSHTLDVPTRTLRISVTEDRAKTRNLRRDPRASFMVTRPDGSAYAVGEGTAQLSVPAAATDDATVDALVDLYRAVQGEHPDWDEYRAAMVEQRRVVLTLPLDRVYGWGGI
ncbi:MAG: PPOX class F420-dependent enzyme [Pseudonocardia sp. SCN 72-86]|nr:MAG: PPOX class F420-dependent enzyme [Pseudonocardia sp. SCN 72-86]